MSRLVKKVPINFKHEGIWKGYSPEIKDLQNNSKILNLVPEIELFDKSCSSVCTECNKIFKNCNSEAHYCVIYNKELQGQWYYEPPVGDGFQLWETVTEGSPISPVFKSLDELCNWAEVNATIWGDKKASKSEWMNILNNNEYYLKLTLTSQTN